MAMRRSRGGRPLTTLPPISTSPSVGSSRPAMVRKRGGLPRPDGPNNTRYSPSRVARLMPSIARTWPWPRPPSNCFVRLRTSTTAIRASQSCGLSRDQPAGGPVLEGAIDLFLGFRDGLLRGELSARCLGIHVGNDEGVQHLTDGGTSWAWVADVGAPVSRIL